MQLIFYQIIFCHHPLGEVSGISFDVFGAPGRPGPCGLEQGALPLYLWLMLLASYQRVSYFKPTNQIRIKYDPWARIQYKNESYKKKKNYNNKVRIGNKMT